MRETQSAPFHRRPVHAATNLPETRKSNRSDSMRVDEAYEIWSRTYDEDRNLTRDLDEQLTREMLKDCRSKSILEIGCGTGKNTRWLSEIGDQVHAIDFSAAMIEQAQQKCTSENVTFSLSDITKRWTIE